MTLEEAWDYLRSGRRTMRLASVSTSGQPHVVPVWYAVIGRQLGIRSASDANTKIRNLLATRRFAATVDEGDQYESLRGVLLQGRAKPADPDFSRTTATLLTERYHEGSELPTHVQDTLRRETFTYVQLIPDAIVSWDNSKLPPS